MGTRGRCGEGRDVSDDDLGLLDYSAEAGDGSALFILDFPHACFILICKIYESCEVGCAGCGCGGWEEEGDWFGGWRVGHVADGRAW